MRFSNKEKVVNKSGVKAFALPEKQKLVNMVLTSFINENKFYGDNTFELIELAKKVDGEFLTKLTIYARQVMNMRTVSHVLAVLIANYHKEYTSIVIPKIIMRVDDLMEILSCQLSMFGKPIPNGLKRALGKQLNNFDEYALGKYKGNKKSLTLKDFIRLTHPKPATRDKSFLFKKAVEGKLEVPYTWEVEISKKGNYADVWEELIDNGALGYMATLRNLNNFFRTEISLEHLDKVIDKLTNPVEVAKSKQLPFRYLSAYITLHEEGYNKNMNKVFEALEKASKLSISNLRRYGGRTLIGIDVSGSMHTPISNRSNIHCNKVATLLGSFANNLSEKADIVCFDTGVVKNVKFDKTNPLKNAVEMCYNGGGTNVAVPLQYAINKGIHYDRIIIISDNEHNSDYRVMEYLKEYKKINPNVWVHCIDLMGYGTTQMKGKNVSYIAGWSEKILDFIHLAENGTSMVDVIEDIEI